MIKNSFLAVFVLSALFFACTPNAGNEQIDPDEILSDSVSNQITHELGTVRKNIEQSASMYNRLFQLNCPYSPHIPYREKPDYDLTSQKAIGFGSYAASFVYSVSYEQTQEARKYLNYIVSLAEDIGIREAFNEEELQLLISNKPDVDKSAVLTRVYLKATEQLYTEQRAILVGYMVIGGWVEGMKMSYETCGEYLDEESIRLGIYDQTYTYFSCKRILETFSEKEEVSDLLKKLEEIEPLIKEVVKTRGQIDLDLYMRVKESVSKLREEIHK